MSILRSTTQYRGVHLRWVTKLAPLTLVAVVLDCPWRSTGSHLSIERLDLCCVDLMEHVQLTSSAWLSLSVINCLLWQTQIMLSILWSHDCLQVTQPTRFVSKTSHLVLRRLSVHNPADTPYFDFSNYLLEPQLMYAREDMRLSHKGTFFHTCVRLDRCHRYIPFL